MFWNAWITAAHDFFYKELAALRAEIQVGLRELDRGEGAELDIEELISQLREEDRHA